MTWEFFFFRQSSSYVSFERYQTKILASSPWKLQILDSSLNIIFLQLPTRHHIFSLAKLETHFLLFKCKGWLSFDFSQCKCHLVQLICYSYVTYIDSSFETLFFNCIGHFLFFRHIALGFLSRHFDFFRCLPVP